MASISFFTHRAAGLALAVAVLAVAGCASSGRAFIPQVRTEAGAEGEKLVRVEPERLVCQSGPRCPLLAAAWSSAKPGQAVLSVQLPGNKAEITGADVHIGGSEVVRLRLRSEQSGAGAPADATAPVGSAFDVPLRLIDRIAYGSRTWMRIYTEGGGSVDEFIHSGEQRSHAAEAMGHFLSAVTAAGGSGAGVDGPRGGLLDRLGVREQ